MTDQDRRLHARSWLRHLPLGQPTPAGFVATLMLAPPARSLMLRDAERAASRLQADGIHGGPTALAFDPVGPVSHLLGDRQRELLQPGGILHMRAITLSMNDNQPIVNVFLSVYQAAKDSADAHGFTVVTLKGYLPMPPYPIYTYTPVHPHPKFLEEMLGLGIQPPAQHEIRAGDSLHGLVDMLPLELVVITGRYDQLLYES